MQESLERLVDAGEIEVADPPTMAHLILAALIEAALLRNEQADARERVEHELRAILAVMTPRSQR